MATEATGEPDEESAVRPSGPKGLPVVGNLHRYLRDPLEFIESCADQYGDVVNTNVVGEAYMITHPESVERVLVTADHRFRKAELGQGRLEPIFGDGLVVSDGERWRRQRTRLQPTFRPEQIAACAGIVAAESAGVAAEWAAGEEIRIDDEMRRLTLSILVRSLFGTDPGDREDDVHEAFSMAMGRRASIDSGRASARSFWASTRSETAPVSSSSRRYGSSTTAPWSS